MQLIINPERASSQARVLEQNSWKQLDDPMGNDALQR